jgi:hypothetical protein
MGFFPKMVLYSAATQSVIGFSSVLVIIMSFSSKLFVSPEVAAKLAEFALSTWYVMVIIPALGTGLVLTIESWRVLFRSRNWLNLATTSWNTFAQIKNTYDAVQSLGPAFDKVESMFSILLESKSSDSKDSGAAKLALVIVLLSLFGGFLITYTIIQHYASKTVLPESVRTLRKVT